jgi:ketosteroid isomerase-like protein
MLARQVALAYAAANRRDFGAVLVGLDPERFEYRPSRDLLPPDMQSGFHGHAGYLDVWRHWLEAFGDIRWDPEEILDLGDTLVVTTQQRGTGSGSGVGVSEPVYQVFTLRRGMVVRQADFLDWDEALGAVAGDS